MSQRGILLLLPPLRSSSFPSFPFPPNPLHSGPYTAAAPPPPPLSVFLDRETTAHLHAFGSRSDGKMLSSTGENWDTGFAPGHRSLASYIVKAALSRPPDRAVLLIGLLAATARNAAMRARGCARERGERGREKNPHDREIAVIAGVLCGTWRRFRSRTLDFSFSPSLSSTLAPGLKPGPHFCKATRDMICSTQGRSRRTCE